MSKTHKEYELEILFKELNFIPLQEYDGANTAISHECFNGHTVVMTPTSILQGTKCPKCKILDSNHEYVQKLLSINSELELLEEYKGTKTKILHRHKVCGYEWKIRPDGILYYNFSCPKCSKYASPKSNEEYLLQLKVANISYTPLELYINYLTPIVHKCPKNHEWKTSPAHIIEGKGCPKCNRLGIYNNKYFINNPEKANSPGVLYLVALVNKDTNTRECLKIGITFGSTNKDILRRAQGFKGYEVRVLKMFTSTLLEVFNKEQILHTYWEKEQHVPNKKFGGWTELFNLNDDIIKHFPNVPS